MSKSVRFDRLRALLKQQGFIEEYGGYLLTPDLVQDIIVATNEGRVNDALLAIDKAESVLTLLSDVMHPEDKKWYLDLIHQVRRAVSSSLYHERQDL